MSDLEQEAIHALRAVIRMLEDTRTTARTLQAKDTLARVLLSGQVATARRVLEKAEVTR